MKKIKLLLALLFILPLIVNAYITPQTDFDFKNTYSLMGAANVTSALFCQINGTCGTIAQFFSAPTIPDSNASTACSGGEHLDGGGTCINTNNTIDARITSTIYYANSSAVTGGSYTDSNYINSTWYYDGISLNFTEGGGINPLDVYVNFTEVDDFSQLVIREYYIGSASHHMQIQIYNYEDAAWEDYFDFVGQSGFTVLTIPVYDPVEHINNSLVKIKLHHIQNGTASHRLYIDYIWLVDGNNIGSSTNLEGYAKYTFGYNNFYGFGNYTTNGIITASNFTGANATIDNLEVRVNISMETNGCNSWPNGGSICHNGSRFSVIP